MTIISGKKSQFLAELRADGAAAAIHTRIYDLSAIERAISADLQLPARASRQDHVSE